MVKKHKNSKKYGIICVPASELPGYPEDFKKSIDTKIHRIMAEFVDGFEFISKFEKSVVVFGSARFPKSNPDYKKAKEFAKSLVKNGFAVITGGGPGIMEAANRGATEAGGVSVGLNIQLPAGERRNPYIKERMSFYYFFTRKVMFSFASNCYVFFPGGFGTLDEFFEMATLRQTKKVSRKVSMICVGKDYWRPLFDWIEKEVYNKRKAITRQDLNLYHLVDTPEEALEIIKKTPNRYNHKAT